VKLQSYKYHEARMGISDLGGFGQWSLNSDCDKTIYKIELIDLWFGVLWPPGSSGLSSRYRLITSVLIILRNVEMINTLVSSKRHDC